MNWIWTNRKWLFSGVGVTIVLLVSGLVYQSYGPRATSTPSAVQGPASTALPESVAFTKPTPDEIYKQLDALPSYQQKGAADAYRGLKVFWPATFEAVEKASESNQWLVILNYYDDKHNQIVCNGIDVETDPRLKLARKGDVVNVHGTIQSVWEIAVVLKDVSIDFK